MPVVVPEAGVPVPVHNWSTASGLGSLGGSIFKLKAICRLPLNAPTLPAPSCSTYQRASSITRMPATASGCARLPLAVRAGAALSLPVAHWQWQQRDHVSE